MSDVDYDALETATKVLLIIFIVLISISNLFLISKVAGKTGYRQCPRSMTLIYLACGDLLLAMYSLLARALLIFNTSLTDDCTNLFVSEFYQKFFIHFLYSIGIFVLAAEIVSRHRYQTQSLGYNSKIRAFFYSFTPWLLALTVVCPLVLVGVKWADCKYSGTADRIKVNFWVSVIAPAGIALITSVIVAIVNIRPMSENTVYGLDNIAPASSSSNDILVNSQFSNISDGSEKENNSLMPNYGTQPQRMQGNSQLLYGTQPYPQQKPSNSQLFYGTHTYHQQPPVYDYSQQFPNIYGPNPRKEKIVLVAVAAIHVLLVVPQAVFYISTWKLSPLWNTILINGLYWLANFRSVITPIIWIISLNN